MMLIYYKFKRQSAKPVFFGTNGRLDIARTTAKILGQLPAVHAEGHGTNF